MLTVWSRLAAACPGMGYKGGAQSPMFEGLHTGSMLSKKEKKEEVSGDKPKKGKKCKKLNLCPDPCEEDLEMDAIAEHVGGRCPKDPCARVRDPCESYVKKHIGSKMITSSNVDTSETKPAAK